jgi:hypothetical protein
VTSPSYDPWTSDDLELAWYFSLGPKPKFRGQPTAAKKHADIARALDGRGATLRAFYASGRDWDALGPDYERTALLLGQEYRDYAARAHRRGRPPKLTPSAVLTDSDLERLLSRPVPPRDETLLGSGGHWYQRKATDEDQFTDALGRVDELEARNLIERATWGDWRITPEGARELLRWIHWYDGTALRIWIRQLDADDELALAALMARVTALPAPVVETDYHEPPNRNLSVEDREVARWALAEEGIAIDPRRLERHDRDPTWTTTTELADAFGVRRDWVRAQLIQRRCPNAGAKRAKLPSAWFATPLGREFWVLLLTESQRVKDERRAARSRELAKVT